MQYTTNYNLITVEGTDVVNPLVQMNPNFTDIDAAMFANKQAVIGTATEITAGTVHAITRTNTDSDYFRFTATSNWTAGDSMSVDGVTVSVYLSDGTAPSTGAYVINTEVLALLSGTRVTLITSNGSVSIAASGVTYDNTGSGLSATDVQDAIDEVNAKFDKGFISVTADGSKTIKTLLNELYALINTAKINKNSTFTYGGTEVSHMVHYEPGNQFVFTNSAARASSWKIGSYTVSANSIARTCIDGTITDISSSIPVTGTTIIIEY